MKSIKMFLSIIICMLFVLVAPKTAKAAESGSYSYDIVDGKAVITHYNSDPMSNGRITIPDTLDGYQVTAIGKSSFAYCGDITKVIIPKGVTSIGDSAFSDCRYLTGVDIPESVTSIGNFAFSGCRFLSSVTMTDSGLITIGQRAFESCYTLTSIKIPLSVKNIGYGAFRFSSISGIVLPEGITSIEANTFEGCSSLKTVTIPKSVTIIKTAAFAGCRSLENIIANPMIAPATETDAFRNVPSTATLTLQKKASGYNKLPWKQWVKKSLIFFTN
ncbi:MAG: leucine-rich repeat protein [Solirubrobacterales bacterium]